MPENPEIPDQPEIPENPEVPVSPLSPVLANVIIISSPLSNAVAEPETYEQVTLK